MRPPLVFFCNASQKPIHPPPDDIKSGIFLPEMLGMALVTAALWKRQVSSPLQLTTVPLALPCHVISMPTPAKLLRAPVLPSQALLEMLKSPDPAGISEGCNGQRNCIQKWGGCPFEGACVSCSHWCLTQQLYRHPSATQDLM